MSKILATPAAKRIARERKISLAKVRSLSGSKYIKSHDVLAQPLSAKTTPLAAKMAEYHNIDATTLIPSGKSIRKKDILKYLNIDTKIDKASDTKGNVIPLSGMRKVIAENMMKSLTTQAQTTVIAEMDTTKLIELHKSLKARFEEKHGVKLTITHLLIKMITMVLMDNPIMNSALLEDGIHLYDEYNIGIATALDKGLIVPVVKNCQDLSLLEICERATDLVTRARDGKLMPSEYSGATFTISNLGNVAIDYFTPIVDSPQTGILGLARTVKKPAVVDDEIVIRSMTGFSMTYDHRVTDGMMAAKFMNSLNAILDNPIEILL